VEGEKISETEAIMTQFAIIEVDDGLTVVEIKPGQKPEEAAVHEGGTLVDPGPYSSYEDAYDALTDLEVDEDDDHA